MSSPKTNQLLDFGSNESTLPQKKTIINLQTKSDISYLTSCWVPKDISWAVMKNMKSEDILNLCFVNKYYANEICTDDFWKYYAKEKYGVTEKHTHYPQKDM